MNNVRGLGGPKGIVDLSFGSQSAPTPRWIVIAGRNGAGKSTFLQAIAMTIVGPVVARVMSESFADWIRTAEAEAFAATKLEFADGDGFTIGRPLTFTPWAALRWKRLEGAREPSIIAANEGGNWNASRGPWSENPRGWFLAGYGPFRRLSPAPSEAQRLMMSPGRPSGLASLFREEASLAESVLWLQQLYLKRLEGNTEAEKTEKTVIKLLNDGLLPDGMKVQSVNSEGLIVRTLFGAELSLRSLSDGYRTVAALVLDLIKQLINSYGSLSASEHDGHPVVLHSGVVLIDEIDVHLHVSWQQRIGFWLKEHFPNLQFIVTTHSPFICQAADEGGLVRLPAPSEDMPPKLVTGELFNRVVNGSADDAVLSDLFGLENSYSSISAKMRDELAALEVKAIEPDSLSEDAKNRIDELKKVLPSTVSADVQLTLLSLLEKLS